MTKLFAGFGEEKLDSLMFYFLSSGKESYFSSVENFYPIFISGIFWISISVLVGYGTKAYDDI